MPHLFQLWFLFSLDKTSICVIFYAIFNMSELKIAFGHKTTDEGLFPKPTPGLVPLPYQVINLWITPELSN